MTSLSIEPETTHDPTPDATPDPIPDQCQY